MQTSCRKHKLPPDSTKLKSRRRNKKTYNFWMGPHILHHQMTVVSRRIKRTDVKDRTSRARVKEITVKVITINLESSNLLFGGVRLMQTRTESSVGAKYSGLHRKDGCMHLNVMGAT